MRYVASLIPFRERYDVCFVDVPGCFAGGADLASALRNAADALALHVGALLADGAALPRPSGIEEARATMEREIREAGGELEEGILFVPIRFTPLGPEFFTRPGEVREEPAPRIGAPARAARKPRTRRPGALRYPAALIPDGGGYDVVFADLPGCRASGADLAEALCRGATALSLHLGGMIADGDELPIPSPAGEARAVVERMLAEEGRRPDGDILILPIGLDLPDRRPRRRRRAAGHRDEGNAARNGRPGKA